MTTTEIDAVLAANAAFYRAMQEGDLALMESLWSRRRPVSCTHPNGPAIQGRAAVMESWRRILVSGGPVPIRPGHPLAVVTGQSAMVICTEEIRGAELMASNTFVREDGVWRVLSHQAAPMPRR